MGRPRREPLKTTLGAAAPKLSAEEEIAAVKLEADQQRNLAQTTLYRCLRCGVGTLNPKDHFFLSSSPMYKENKGFVPICKACFKEIYTEILDKFGDADLALKACCHYLDWAYDPVIARKAREAKSSFPLAEYSKRIGASRFSKQTYVDTMYLRITNSAPTAVETREKLEQMWDQTSLQNMQFIKNTVGYDPFSDDNLSSSDRKFLFNTMAGYCPDSSVADDSHKLQSIINIVQLQLQVHKIGEQINQELAKYPIDADKVDDYTTIQKNLYQSINTMAKENGISASGSGGVKPANTLTQKMKKLQEEGFDEIEVNMFNIEQSKALQTIADISMHSIIKELQLEANDYAEIRAEQVEIINKLRAERDKAVEENRILRNEKILYEAEQEEYKRSRQKSQ